MPDLLGVSLGALGLRADGRPYDLLSELLQSARLGKLGVRDRLQAAVAAYDAGLVRPHGS